jgi:hypothetical protein
MRQEIDSNAFGVCHPDRSAAWDFVFRRKSGAEWRDPEDASLTMLL